MRNPTSGLTPMQVSKKYGVGIHEVLGWIDRGELAAINVANNQRGRPRWVVLTEAIADFERRRSAQPKPPTRRGAKPKPSGVTEYF